MPNCVGMRPAAQLSARASVATGGPQASAICRLAAPAAAAAPKPQEAPSIAVLGGQHWARAAAG